jgi:hypothetical protein
MEETDQAFIDRHDGFSPVPGVNRQLWRLRNRRLNMPPINERNPQQQQEYDDITESIELMYKNENELTPDEQPHYYDLLGDGYELIRHIDPDLWFHFPLTFAPAYVPGHAPAHAVETEDMDTSPDIGGRKYKKSKKLTRRKQKRKKSKKCR